MGPTRWQRNDRQSLRRRPVCWHQLQRSAAGPQCSDVPRERPPAALFCSESLCSPANQTLPFSVNLVCRSKQVVEVVLMTFTCSNDK